MNAHQHGDFLTELLNGRDLAFVTLLREYMQLNFDGPCLNIYTPPELGFSSLTLKQSDQGFYDSLFKLVGKRVIAAREFSGICLMLNFEGDVFLRISIKSEDRQCAEAAMLQDGNGKQWNVW
jgi:hypothetical protein